MLGDIADVVRSMQFIDDVPVTVVALLTPAQDDLFSVPKTSRKTEEIIGSASWSCGVGVRTGA